MANKSDRKYRAIRKGVRTRAANRAMLKRYYEIELPSHGRIDEILNYMLSMVHIELRWNPLTGESATDPRGLKNGAEIGTLVKFSNGGRLLTVLPEGYKRPQTFHAAFWELNS